MSTRLSSERPSPRRRAGLVTAAAVAALLAAGAIGGEAVTGPAPARAQALALTQPAQGVPSFADVVDTVKPAVVSVRVRLQTVSDRGGERGSLQIPDLPDDHPLREFFRRFGDGERGPPRRGPDGPRRGGQSQGSGFFISADGYVVTNNHVVQNGQAVEIVMDDGRALDAKVVGTDPKTDLALLKVNEGGTFPYVRLAAEKPRIGEWVVAIGNPFGLGGTVTAGIVSAHGRNIGAGPYDDFLQIDAAVNRGNSGGPTFNLKGEVVGVNTAIFSPSGGNVGIAFAIPAATTQSVVTALKETGSVARGFIGVRIQPVTREIAEAIGLKDARGALIAGAEAGSPADRAGLKAGDTILAIGGEPVREARDLSRKVADLAPGRSVPVTVYRDGRERTVTIEIGRQSGV